MINYLLDCEAARLTRQIKECTSTLGKSPDGKIRASITRGKYVKWYHVVDGTYRTLPKTNQINWIISCETEGNPLDCIFVERMIQHFLE